MHRQNYDLIVFDWDGTLMDSTAAITGAIQQACQDLGLPVPSREDASFVIGLGLEDALRHTAPTLPHGDYPRLAAAYRKHYFALDGQLTLFDGVLDLLHGLKSAGYNLAVATGKSRIGLARAMDRPELRGLFDATRTADETFSKPHPAMLHELMAELASPPQRTVMVGDTTHDLQMAINAQCNAIGVSYGAHDAEQLQSLEPLGLVHSVAELRDFLAANG
ncbi:HAD-IA family hydrolase [Thiomonas bhubaneswarensis]|uniref:Haloacid dehalogenase superfamily, subfamily IA, variant 3 with third motif having DD or ED/haloacid dehalogenase superfamily, subfamily IA, variant 1 with third motif having Dx(3-4)D or Dx(3-4)E n=1 Tax=Thiomonas bhubaneswarensis TaxID=339866 RepID=A0A0K6I3E6_9BURK|nr:HAD-IA family hydrolase [Thiomonas bhubaneswarensis]CUA97655.1 haloacid dehalogenase superfamily, subfamily IA, variant 3 with third motif having DD or ED/haloacid dehalogenase superfamily, subfamily IA, variant 1 with third motif having Dx(3-4)D or Dx(3-4)E [Thiomonas bhubaneswarensis]